MTAFFCLFVLCILDIIHYSGQVEEMNVCDNLGDHLVGNVFVKFKREEDAEKAVACEVCTIYLKIFFLFLMA